MRHYGDDVNQKKKTKKQNKNEKTKQNKNQKTLKMKTR